MSNNKDFAWQLFKNTGNIDAYMFMKDVEYGEQMLDNVDGSKNVLGDCNGDYKNQRDSY